MMRHDSSVGWNVLADRGAAGWAGLAQGSYAGESTELLTAPQPIGALSAVAAASTRPQSWRSISSPITARSLRPTKPPCLPQPRASSSSGISVPTNLSGRYGRTAGKRRAPLARMAMCTPRKASACRTFWRPVYGWRRLSLRSARPTWHSSPGSSLPWASCSSWLRSPASGAPPSALRSRSPSSSAFATPLWPYSRSLFQETPSAFALLLAVFAITGRVRVRVALLAGLAIGLGIAIRTTNALALAPARGLPPLSCPRLADVSQDGSGPGVCHSGVPRPGRYGLDQLAALRLPLHHRVQQP